jgi:heme-degrading monooxygenase HmoA
MALKGRRSESLSPGANQYWPLIAPLDDPQIAGFVARLEEINSLADNAPGFVWRLQTEEGDATNLRPFDDEQIIVNLSVWESLEQLKDFVFKSAHNEVLKQRRQWVRCQLSKKRKNGSPIWRNTAQRSPPLRFKNHFHRQKQTNE